MSYLQYYMKETPDLLTEYFLIHTTTTSYLVQVTTSSSTIYLQGKRNVPFLEDKDLFSPTKHRERSVNQFKAILAHKLTIHPIPNLRLICDEDELTFTEYLYLYILLEYNELT